MSLLDSVVNNPPKIVIAHQRHEAAIALKSIYQTSASLTTTLPSRWTALYLWKLKLMDIMVLGVIYSAPSGLYIHLPYIFYVTILLIRATFSLEQPFPSSR